jgi:hypothetical protein
MTPAPTDTRRPQPTSTPALAVSKDQIDGRNYTITIANEGVGYVTGLLLTEQLRPGVFFVSSAPSEPVCHESGGTIRCDLGELAGGLSAGVRIEAEAEGVDLLSGQTGVQADGVPAIVIEDPYLAKFAAPAFVAPGEDVSWTIRVLNPGNRVAANLQVVEGQQVIFRLPLLAPVDAVTITIRTRLRDDVEIPVIPNRACLTTRENPLERCAEANLFKVRTLPATGESPWGRWRLPLFGLALWIGAATLYALRRLVRRRFGV